MQFREEEGFVPGAEGVGGGEEGEAVGEMSGLGVSVGPVLSVILFCFRRLREGGGGGRRGKVRRWCGEESGEGEKGGRDLRLPHRRLYFV